MKLNARPLMLAVLVAALVAIAAYVSRRPACDADRSAAAGDVRREAGGKLVYFDGHCWTTKSPPPRDLPF